MKEARKIILILGNGFDLDLGLKTSYKDFWESEFCPKHYPAPLIYHLNQRWPENKESVRWYDLENELLNYYDSISNPHIGDEYITSEEKAFLISFIPANCHFGMYYEQNDIIQSLINKGVIAHIEEPFPFCSAPYKDEVFKTPIERDKVALQLIKEGLCKYIKDKVGTPKKQASRVAFQVLNVVLSSARKGDCIGIYSFNYTSLQLLSHYLYGKAIDESVIHYMHGSCETSIIVGTRDSVEMTEEYDFLQKVMDDSFNPPSIVSELKDADDVIFFGHSLGKNDRQYFAPFFKRLSNENTPVRKDLTIFTRDNKSQKEIKRALQIMTDGHLSSLYSINQPKIIKTANLADDKDLFYKFLISHDTDEFAAQQILSELLKRHN